MASAGTDKAVVAAVPAARAQTAITVGLGAVTLPVAVILARNWLVALLTIVLGAALYSAGMVLLFRRIRRKWVPRVVAQDELPPVAASWKVIAVPAILLGALDIGTVVFALALHPQQFTVVGIAVSSPVIYWESYRSARRTQRAHGGVLYSTAFAWTARSRALYIVSGPALP